MEPSSTEVAELMGRVAALRAAMGRVQAELDALFAAEQALAEKLRAMGLDDAQTTVDLPTIPGLPSRRRRSGATPSAPPPARDVSPMKAAAIGAGLTLALALVILLVVNLQLSRHAAPAAAPAPAAASALVVTSPPTASAPPEPAPSAAPPASADAKPEMGALTIVCTPRCDSIVDNGTPLSPGTLVAVPVPAGMHKIVVAGNGVRRTLSVTVAPGQTRDVRVSLEALPVDRGF